MKAVLAPSSHPAHLSDPVFLLSTLLIQNKAFSTAADKRWYFPTIALVTGDYVEGGTPHAPAWGRTQC